MPNKFFSKKVEVKQAHVQRAVPASPTILSFAHQLASDVTVNDIIFKDIHPEDAKAYSYEEEQKESLPKKSFFGCC